MMQAGCTYTLDFFVGLQTEKGAYCRASTNEKHNSRLLEDAV